MVETWDGWKVGQPQKDKVTLLYYLLPPEKLTNNLVSCGLFDWRGGSDASKDKIYFKSEVVVKDENYGWIMWNGLSSDPSSTSKKVDFEYRLLTLKKENGAWKIDKGFGWTTPTSSETSGQAKDKLHIKIPTGHKWHTTKTRVGNGYSTRQVWSGIAKIDSSSRRADVKTHPIESLEIYMRSKTGQRTEDKYDAEFFGLGGGCVSRYWYGLCQIKQDVCWR